MCVGRCCWCCRGALNLCDLCACVHWGAEVGTLVCLGSLQEICADELMVAEQWCRRCSGVGVRVKDGEKEKLLLHPAPPDSRRLQKPSWGSLALSQRWWRRAAGWRGEREGKGGRVNTTRTEQRQATGFLVFFYVWEAEGAGIVLYCGGSLPHQHTAAVTRGHQQRPVKEKH